MSFEGPMLWAASSKEDGEPENLVQNMTGDASADAAADLVQLLSKATVPLLLEGLSALNLPDSTRFRSFTDSDRRPDRVGEERDFVVWKRRRVESFTNVPPCVIALSTRAATREERSEKQYEMLLKLPRMASPQIEEEFKTKSQALRPAYIGLLPQVPHQARCGGQVPQDG